ncbi:MAG TPA: class I SAM-dependent methyltransferase [Syntrophales bacterium]|nr:class I SAM-dependent methyltransferase [Syntrophales bacterium]
MDAEKRDFDRDAKTYDLKPGHVKLAEDVASAIMRELKPNRDMDVLDFGCGTGLVTLQLQPFVRTITGADSSLGMLDVLNAKIIERKLVNVKTEFIDIERGERLKGRFHLIVSSMTLHHITDLDRLCQEFYDCILPGGHLSIADLDSDGGDFHRGKTGVVHSGFDRPVMRERFIRHRFQDVGDVTAASVVKDLPDGRSREFTVFLMYGRR